MHLPTVFSAFLVVTSSVIANPTPNLEPSEPMLATTLDTRQISVNPSEIRFVARLMDAEREDFSRRMNSFINTLNGILQKLPEDKRGLAVARSRLDDDVKRVLVDMDAVAKGLNALAGSV